jgi:hypothetical protein
MVYEEIRFGESTTLTISGNDETIVVRVNHRSDNKEHHKIKLHPGLFESIFPSFCEHPIIFMSEDQKKVAFKCRIKKCIKIYSEFAQRYIKEDEKWTENFLAGKKREEERLANIKDFVKNVVKEIEPKETGDDNGNGS